MRKFVFLLLTGSLWVWIPFFLEQGLASDPETVGTSRQGAVKEKVHEGNLLFGKSDLQGALLHYQEVLNEAGRLEGPLRPRSEASEPRLGAGGAVQAKIHYNIANTLSRLGRFKEAEKEYQKSLRLDPKFEDGKYNLEATLLAQEGISGILRPQAEIEGASEQLDEEILRLLQVLEQKEFGLPKGVPQSQTPPQPQPKESRKDW